MRALLVIVALVTVLGAQAQIPVVGGLGYTPWQMAPLNSNYLKTNSWQLRPSVGLDAGYIFYNGGISYLSAPLALTLYRPLTTHFTAFGGVYAAPTVFNVNDLRVASPMNQRFSGSPFSGPYGLGINAGVQGGLMYTNDAHTFSISGSVILQRGSTPVYYPSQRVGNSKE